MSIMLSDLIERSLGHPEFVDIADYYFISLLHAPSETETWGVCPLARAAIMTSYPDMIKTLAAHERDPYPAIRTALREAGIEPNQSVNVQHTPLTSEPLSLCAQYNRGGYSVSSWLVHLTDRHDYTPQQIIDWLREQGL